MEKSEFAYYEEMSGVLFVTGFGMFSWRTISETEKGKKKKEKIISELEKSAIQEINKIEDKKYTIENIKEKRLNDILGVFVSVIKKPGKIQVSSKYKKILDILIMKYKIMGVYPISFDKEIKKDGTKVFTYEFYVDTK